MACTSWSRQKSVSRPSKPAIRTFGYGALASVSISMRSSGLNSRFFDALTPTATTTSSKSREAREMMSM
jgi:hypothetical protein